MKDDALARHFGWTDLIVACRRGDAEQVERCLARKVDIDQGDGDGSTALMHAAKSADSRLIQRLLSAGADTKKVDFKGRTALMWATWCNPPESGSADCIVLLWKGSDAMAVDDQGLDVVAHARVNANEKAIAVIEAMRMDESVETNIKKRSARPRI